MTHRTIGSVAIHTGLSVRALWLVATAYGSAMALIVVWQSHRWEDVFATWAVDELASLFGVLVAAGCAGWAARSARSRAQRGWLALAAGLLGWAVGEGLWCYQELWLRSEDSALRAMADGLLLLFPLGGGTALLLLSIRDSGQSQSRLILDGVIVGISLFIVRGGRLSHRQPSQPVPIGWLRIVGSGRAVDDRRTTGRALTATGTGRAPRCRCRICRICRCCLRVVSGWDK